MHIRIAVHLARRRLQNLRLRSLGKTQHVDGAMHARLGGLHRIELIMDRRGRTCEVVDLVDLDIERKGNVMADELESGLTDERENVVAHAREEVVHADHVVAMLQQSFAKMRAQKSGAAGDEDAPTHKVAHGYQ